MKRGGGGGGKFAEVNMLIFAGLLQYRKSVWMKPLNRLFYSKTFFLSEEVSINLKL